MKINYKKIHPLAQVPVKAHSGDAGYDLISVEYLKIPPLQRALVSTGIQIQIPEEASCYGRIAPRSGLAVKKGLDVMAGVVDSSYRGEIKVVLINLCPPSPEPENPLYHIGGDKNCVEIQPGQRVAQLVFENITHFDEWEETSDLNFLNSNRAEGGFGSTG